MDFGGDLPLALVAGLVLVAFAAGFISAIAGAGGMIVLPMLLWAGLPPLNALATNKFQSVFGTLSSTLNFFRRGHIDFKELRLGLVCAFIGSLLGTWGVQNMDAALLKAAIPYALIAVALYMLLSPSIADVDSPPKMSRRAFDVSVAGGIGCYGGLFGPGMGSFYAAAFAGLRGNNMRTATAHTKPLVLITNFTSMVVFMLGGHLVWGLAIIMALAQFAGARLGSNLVISQGAKLVKPVIIVATVAIALRLIFAQ